MAVTQSPCIDLVRQPHHQCICVGHGTAQGLFSLLGLEGHNGIATRCGRVVTRGDDTEARHVARCRAPRRHHRKFGFGADV